MAGTKEGSRKAAKTNKERYGDDFYSKIGTKSWKNPNRSRKTGFALLSRETVAELGRKGGKKTKDDYRSTKTQAETEAIGLPADGGLNTGIRE